MNDKIKNSQLEFSATHLLHRAGQCAGDIFQSIGELGGLTPRQYAVLLAVSHNEGLSQTDLVEATGVDRSTLADIVRRMLSKGLLQRQRTKEDARVYSVKLTEKGRIILNEAAPAAALVDERILSALSPASRDDFLQSLITIVATLDENTEKIVETKD